MKPSLLVTVLLAAALGGGSGYFAWRDYAPAPVPVAEQFPDPLTDPAFLAIVPDRPPTTDTDLLGTNRPPFELLDIAGAQRSAKEFDGKVVVLNFWATWCGPCREEMPMLVDLQRKYGARGLQVVGVALDDRESVENFAAEFGIDYPLMIGETEVMALGKRYGNTTGGIPYTALVDRAGRIQFLKAGRLHLRDIEPVVEQFL
jgi:thiol-disulfide isomerase/thioredoxin